MAARIAHVPGVLSTAPHPFHAQPHRALNAERADTNAPHTIGHAMSLGCCRLANEQVGDLYECVAVGTKVVAQQ